MSHIFISYSRADIDFARYLKALLEAEGLTVWIDEAQLSASARWWKMIEQNIEGCAAFVVVMSPDAAESDWVEREILLAESRKRPIFPVLLAGDAWSRLANIQFEDMRSGLRTRLSTRFISSLKQKTGGKAAPARGIDFTIAWSDITEVKADVAAFKYAQNFQGADAVAGSLLVQTGMAVEDIRPEVGKIGAYRYLETRETMEARYALFVGTPRLRQLGYQQIREFAARVLEVLTEVAPQTRHLAMTTHGPGFSLDEIEALLSQFGGYRDGMLSGKFPPALNQITIVEINEGRVERLRQAMDKTLAEADYATRWAEGWGYRLSLPGAAAEVAGEPTAIESAGAKAAKPHAFVALPRTPEMEDAFYFGIQAPIHACGLLCERVDLVELTEDLLEQIKQRIETAAVVVADLSRGDPTVFLQLGYAWGKNRTTILVANQGQGYATPLFGDKLLLYERIKELEVKLVGRLDGLKAEGKL